MSASVGFEQHDRLFVGYDIAQTLAVLKPGIFGGDGVIRTERVGFDFVVVLEQLL